MFVFLSIIKSAIQVWDLELQLIYQRQPAIESMSSEDIALYLCEVASNERKLEYCRQILAANTNFIPEAIFSLNSPQPRTSISRSDFVELLKSLALSSSQQEIELIFTYFQTQAKNYLTLEEFSSLITPQIDQSLKSLVARRSQYDFKVDYALRYSLQKFFFQVVENQVRLELLCKFTFEKEKDQKRVKHRKLTAQYLKEFLGFHGKYTSQSELTLILKEIGLNKGEGKRNRLISEFVILFTDRRRDNQQAPKVYSRQLSAMADIRAKYQSTIENQENLIANSRYQVSTAKQESQYHSRINPASQLQSTQNRQLQQVQAKTTTKDFSNNINSVIKVEDRIKTLMDSINLNGKMTISRREEDTIENKRPKQTQKSQRPASNNKPMLKKLDFKDSIIANIYSNDNQSQRRERQHSKSHYDAESITDRIRTDRYQRSRITEQNLQAQSSMSSQLQKSKATDRFKSVDKSAKHSQAQSRKRIEYLKSLIDSNQDKKENYMRKYQA